MKRDKVIEDGKRIHTDKVINEKINEKFKVSSIKQCYHIFWSLKIIQKTWIQTFQKLVMAKQCCYQNVLYAAVKKQDLLKKK